MLSSELFIQVESEALLEFALSYEAGKHSNDSRTWSGFFRNGMFKYCQFIFADCHLGWPVCLPFEYGIESKSSLISFLFLTGNDMACDDMRESTSKTFCVSLMVNC